MPDVSERENLFCGDFSNFPESAGLARDDNCSQVYVSSQTLYVADAKHAI